MKTPIILAVLLSTLGSAAPRALSVCETTRVGEQFEGKSVRISGTWRKAFPGSETFDELTDDKCPGVQIQVVAAVGSLPHAPPSSYKLDPTSVRRAQNVATKALVDGHDLSVTIVGVLYAQKREDYVPAQPLSNKVTIVPHHKWYPFILLIESIPEIREN